MLNTPTGSATLTVPLAPRTTASAVTIAGIIRPSNLSGFGTIVEDNGSLFGLLLEALAPPVTIQGPKSRPASLYRLIFRIS